MTSTETPGIVHDTEPREVTPDSASDGSLEAVIGAQVRNLRISAGLSLSDMATRVGISKAMLSKIENAQASCSLATLSRLSTGLDVPVTTLFRGAGTQRESVYTRAGSGAHIVGRGTRSGHHYEMLGALRGQHRRLEAVVVTLEQESTISPRFQHPGTELLFMLQGDMVYTHDGSDYRLRAGDSLLLDGEGLHGPKDLFELPITFLAVTAYPDNHVA
ncbi:helix-turn-helix domain-containing protein [Rhodococcus sp. KBS0724]|uniref:helix-turn-helix domain-containing protein n=1 Tax=Rhodococcus sp. KBS0724 TaxID=1179674 RepID=UPI00110E863B|nr:XRE family transcriptional regulator [Rhodococcus sp. KBS0724]TSD47856.1 helix-turn-helix domain-containing protein [Rhodococcus sp. KBS0724]